MEESIVCFTYQKNHYYVLIPKSRYELYLSGWPVVVFLTCNLCGKRTDTVLKLYSNKVNGTGPSVVLTSGNYLSSLANHNVLGSQAFPAFNCSKIGSGNT